MDTRTRPRPASRRAPNLPHPELPPTGLLKALIGAGAFVIALGVIGPALDGAPDGTPPEAAEAAGQAKGLRAGTADICRQIGGDDARWVSTGSGSGLACTDPSGRWHLHIVSNLHQVRR